MDTTVVIVNEGAAAHNVTIDALNFSVAVEPEEAVEAVLNAPAGTCAYPCNVPGHAAVGRGGTLTVE